jgi:hypothetical protein
VNDNSALLGLSAKVDRGHCNTDRVYNRIRFAGKGREGNRITFYAVRSMHLDLHGFGPVLFVSGDTVHEHDSSQTYRSNDEIESWLKRYISNHIRAAARKKLLAEVHA